MATIVSIFVPIVYGLFILAADVVFVIVLPQLFCAVFIKRTNVYGAITGFLLGSVLRMGAGEALLDWQPFIEYPFYSVDSGQQFPFRTFAMVVSLVTIVTVSLLADLILRYLCPNSRHKTYLVSGGGEGNVQTQGMGSHSSHHPLISISK
jgi:high affinity choline transporter 7